MSKEELKNYLKKLELPEELEKLIFELIDNAAEVNQTLLNAVADILDLQADFYEKEAEILEEEADEYEALQEELKLLDQEEYQARLEAIKKNQEKLLEEINQKINELKGRASIDDVSKIEEIKQTLQQQATS